MNALTKKYEALLGRKPSIEEYENLSRIAQALNLRENDAFWCILLILEDYGRRYRQAPARIEAAVGAAVQSVGDVAEHETKLAADRAIAGMAAETAHLAREIAHKTAGRDRAKWLAVSATVSTALLASVFSAGFFFGHETGVAEAGAAAKWVLTDEGQTAQALAELGSLFVVADCVGEGWYIERHTGDTICRAPQGAGWFIP